MPERPDDLGAAMQELADREVPAADERFEPRLRHTLRLEPRPHSGRWPWIAAGCLACVAVAAIVAVALPATARHLPLPVGRELQRLDARTQSLDAALAAQTRDLARLRAELAVRLVLVQTARGRWVVAHYLAPRTTPAPPAPPGYGASWWGWVAAPASPIPTSTPLTAPTISSPSPLATTSSSPTPTATPSSP